MDIANLVIRVTNDGLSAAQRELRRLRDEADGTRTSTSKLGDNLKRLSKYGAVALGGLAVAAIKVSGDFEESMNAVRAVSGATGKDFDDLRNLAKKMGSETAFSATEAANGMEYLAMAGLNTEQVLATIPNALDLAAAGSIDLAQSADILSNVMSGMGIAAEDSARVADVLAATAAGANTNISALGEAMKYVAPVAKTMGYSLEEVSASIGILGNAGIAAGQAGTSLRAIMSRTASHNTAIGAYKELGVTVTDAEGNMRSMTEILSDLQVATKDMSSADQIAVFKDIAGAEAMGALAVLVDGVANDSLPQLTASLQNAEGAAKRMAEIRMEGLNGAIKGAKSAAEGFLIAIGDAGLLDLAANGVTILADGVRGLSEELPIAVENITAFFEQASIAETMDAIITGLKTAWDNLWSVIEKTGEVIKPVIDFFIEHEELSKSLATAIGIVAAGFVIYNAAVVIGTAVTGGFVAVLALVTAPITLIVVAMTALVAAGVYVYRNWDTIKAKAIEIWGAIKQYISDKVEGAKQAMIDKFNAAKNAVINKWNELKTGTVNKFNEIKESIISALKELPSKLFSIGADMTMGLINGLKSKASAVASAAWDMGKNAYQSLKNSVEVKSPSKLTTRIGKDFGQGMANGIKKKGKVVKSAAQKLAEGAVKATQDGIASLKREIALFGDDDIFAALNYDIKIGKLAGDTDQLAGLIAYNEQLKANAKTTTDLAAANKSVQDSIDGLIKKQALFGNDSATASLLYDIEVLKLYKGASQELTDEYVKQTKALEQLGLKAAATAAIQDRFAKLKTDQETSRKAVDGVMSEIDQETPLGKIQADYDRRLETIRTNEMLETGIIGSEVDKRLAIEKSYMDAKRDLMLTQGEALFGNLAGLSKAFLGEQSSLYKGLFAVEKAYTLASVLLSNEKAISKAWASAPFPYNLGAVASTVAGTAGIASAVAGIMPKGFKSGGYTGNGGTNQVAGEVHGQEYVFDAKSTRDIGVGNLDAMRRGDKPKGGDGEVNITVNVDAQGNSSMSGDQGNAMGKQMANGIKGLVQDMLRKEKRQGGMLYGA